MMKRLFGRMPAGWCAGGRPAEQRWLHVSRCTAAGAGARRRSNHAPRQQQQQQKKKPQQQQQKKKRKVAANAAGLGVPQANVRRLPKFNRRAVKRLPLGGVAVHGLNGFRVEDKTPLLASERKALTVLSQRMPVYLGNHHTVFRNGALIEGGGGRMLCNLGRSCTDPLVQIATL